MKNFLGRDTLCPPLHAPPPYTLGAESWRIRRLYPFGARIGRLQTQILDPADQP